MEHPVVGGNDGRLRPEGPQHCGLRTQAEVCPDPQVCPNLTLTHCGRIGQAIVGGPSPASRVLWRSLSRFTVLSDFGFPMIATPLQAVDSASSSRWSKPQGLTELRHWLTWTL